MKAAAQMALAFWVSVAVVLSIAWFINGSFERMPAGCKMETVGAGIHVVCPEPQSSAAFWRIKKIKCKGKWGTTHCHTQWTIGVPPKLDQG